MSICWHYKFRLGVNVGGELHRRVDSCKVDSCKLIAVQVIAVKLIAVKLIAVS
jgi:hypothetical protein